MAGTASYRLEIRDVPAQTVGSIRGCVPARELDAWTAAAIHELFARLNHQRIQPAGAPFAIRPAPQRSGEDEVELEVALPAIRRVAGRGRMTGRTLPSCRALSTLHRGPHEQLAAAHRAIAEVIAELGVETAGEPREVYLTNPLETPPDRCETEVLWPVDVPAGWKPAAANGSPGRKRLQVTAASRAGARSGRRRRTVR